MSSVDRLRGHLGGKYTVREINGERCIYRDCGLGFEILVRCPKNNKRPAKVYLYHKLKSRDERVLVEKADDTPRSEVKRVCDRLYNKYLGSGMAERHKANRARQKIVNERRNRT